MDTKYLVERPARDSSQAGPRFIEWLVRVAEVELHSRRHGPETPDGGGQFDWLYGSFVALALVSALVIGVLCQHACLLAALPAWLGALLLVEWASNEASRYLSLAALRLFLIAAMIAALAVTVMNHQSSRPSAVATPVPAATAVELPLTP